MKRFFAASMFSAFFVMSAHAQSPVGEWLVEDGTARIRVLSCGSALWGVVSWTKDAPGKDENNPDPAKQNRSVLGIPILIDMKAGKPNRWDGQVYNAENGETYTSHITLEGPNALRIDGCVLGGIICGGENWTRYTPVSKSEKPGAPDAEVCATLSK